MGGQEHHVAWACDGGINPVDSDTDMYRMTVSLDGLWMIVGRGWMLRVNRQFTHGTKPAVPRHDREARTIFQAETNINSHLSNHCSPGYLPVCIVPPLSHPDSSVGSLRYRKEPLAQTSLYYRVEVAEGYKVREW